jgi:SAM-dependent methyltransferase
MHANLTTEELESAFMKAPDKAFRGRAVSEYQRVRTWIRGVIDLDKARILDFGCGTGIAATSFALRHPNSTVHGVDIVPVDQPRLRKAFNSQIGKDIPSNVEFHTLLPGVHSISGKYDLIFAWSVFGHIPEHDIAPTFEHLRGSLSKGGRLFIQSSPLYFSPEGSLLGRYYKAPWHHLLLTIDQLRDGVFSAGAGGTETREWHQFLGLNRLTAEDIIDRATGAGLNLNRIKKLHTELVPPPRLTRVYDADVLTTTEFMALFDAG